jgi:hypothetical protein
VTFLADVPEQTGGNDVFDAVHIETLCVAGCDVFNAQLAQQLQQAKVNFLNLPVINQMKRSNPTRNTQRAIVRCKCLILRRCSQPLVDRSTHIFPRSLVM